ncbi:MAG TPA: hypothetical protein VGM97_21085 [Steroidobacteraceae bacterium]|jgi:type I restriction enzyme M protein
MAGAWTISGNRWCPKPDWLCARFGRGASQLSEEEHAKSNLPDVLGRWIERDGSELERPRSAQSFCVPKGDIEAAGYDPSIGRYRDIVHADVAHRAPKEIIAELKRMESKIIADTQALEDLLS